MKSHHFDARCDVMFDANTSVMSPFLTRDDRHYCQDNEYAKNTAHSYNGDKHSVDTFEGRFL